MDKKILVTQSSMPNIDEYIEEIKSIWDTKWLTNNGEKHNQLEKELSEYLKVNNTTLFCNGHMALYTALKALDLKGEVITTPFTFASTTHAIVQNGLTPVFCDINPNDYTIDVNKIESLITDKTSAIVPVHVYGNPCNVKKIEEIAKKYNLKVIYDAAHAFGVEINDKGISNFGDASMFSFHATKVFNTIEGGAIVYNDENLKSRLNLLKNFGIEGPETVSAVGMNAKMNEFSAAMGLCNLRHIKEEIEKRKDVVERYLYNLYDIDGIILPKYRKDVKYNYAYMPVVFDESKTDVTRDEINDELARNNVIARKYFYPLIQDFDCYKEQYSSDDTPIAKAISDRILTLPLYADLELENVDNICNIIKNKILEKQKQK